MNLINQFIKDQSGDVALEYGLVAALMATGVIAAVGALTPKLSTAFNDVGVKLTSRSGT